MKQILSKLFPTNDIPEYIIKDDTINEVNNGEKNINFLINQDNKSSILFKSIESLQNISLKTSENFVNHIKEYNLRGIFISQISGIIGKPDYHIEIYNNTNIVIYIQNCNYDYNKIQNAKIIIDVLYSKLDILTDKQNLVITNDLLKEISTEYQSFIFYKDTIINHLKENTKNMLNSIENFKFPILDNYLSTYCIDTHQIQKQKYTCDICNIFTSYKLKGIAAHKKGCKRKKNYILLNSTINPLNIS
jgi:hypothetical protein